MKKSTQPKLTPNMRRGLEYIGKLIAENKDLRDAAQRREEWLRRAKSQAGYSNNVSFDVVWDAALAALTEKLAKEKKLPVWDSRRRYRVGTRVFFVGRVWECLQNIRRHDLYPDCYGGLWRLVQERQ